MRSVRFPVALVIMLVGSAVAQHAPAPTFKSRADLVLVPVVVQYKDGQPVSGLPANAFALEDNGFPQALASVDEVTADNSLPAPPAELADAVARGVIFTNQLANPNQPKELIIFALDLINSPFVETEQGRKAMLNFIATHMSPTRMMGLVVIEPGRVRLLHAFTTSPTVLSSALQKVTAVTTTPASQEPLQAEAALVDAQRRLIESETTSLKQFVAEQEVATIRATMAVNAARRNQNIASALESLRQIASWVAGVPGRKVLVWLTGDIPFVTGQGNVALGKLAAEDYERTMKALAQANVALYPVDVRGVVPEPMFNRAYLESQKLAQDIVLSMDGSPTGIQQRSEALHRGPEQVPDSHAAMNYLANLTGGRAYYNRNDIPRVLDDASADSSHYYMLSYYLDRSRAKPGWHKLKVSVSHEKVTVRARNGFFLDKPGQEGSPSVKQQDESTALASPFEYTALPITLRWTTTASSGEKRRVNFEVYVPPSSRLVGGDLHDIDLDFIATATGGKREIAAQSSKGVRTQLKPESQQQIQTNGLTYLGNLDLKPGHYAVRLLVRDNLTGRLGSVIAPLDVAP